MYFNYSIPKKYIKQDRQRNCLIAVLHLFTINLYGLWCGVGLNLWTNG